MGSGWHSLIDSRSFFLAERGKSDPKAELEATLAAFFAPAPKGEDQQPAQCAFIARYRWLEAELDFDPKRLPEQRCERFEDWLAAIDAQKVTLIFPTAYMNNPSSMFGHTFLRFDRADQNERTRLLSYAVNYGAVTGSDNGVLFAIYGLTGGYPGTYSVMPYYQMVQKYSDYENRDIWEYQLNFTAAETQRMLEHLWELREQSADYFFFDENCSYQLLFLLDVARPGLDLTDDFQVYAIPVDTLRAVLEKRGLLSHAVFRPSSRTRIEHRLRLLQPAERALVERLADGRVPADDPALEAPSPRRAAMLELAAAVVTYRMRTGQTTREESGPRALALLTARSRIAAAADVPPVPQPATRPDQGHDSARLALGLGMRDGRFFQSLRLRPAYHDLSDPPGGYLPGAAIDFLDLEVRHYARDHTPTLESLTLLGIRSISARNALFKPVSWELHAGLERFRNDDEDAKGNLVAAFSGGAGPAFEIGDGALASLMAEATVATGTDCPSDCFAGLGPSLVVVWPATDRWTLALDGRFQLLLSKETDRRFALGLDQSFALRRNLALKLGLALEDEGGGAQAEWSTSLHLYF